MAEAPDVSVRHDPVQYQRLRIREGLEQNIWLVVAKGVIFASG